jgi:GNAT superfamily N-acetyltransferase
MNLVIEAIVRTARDDEARKLIEIYAGAASELPAADAENLLPRPFKEVDAAVRQGLFLVIEDQQGEFLAGSGVFDLSDANYKEFGMTYVRPRAQGFGLQKFLMKLRVCIATLAEVPDERAGLHYAELITAIKPTNKRSLKSAQDTGFTRMTELPPALVEPCANCKTGPCEGRACCCDFFQLSIEQRAREIENALGLSRWERSHASGDGSAVRIELKLRALTDATYREALAEIVSDLRSKGSGGDIALGSNGVVG